MEERGVAHSGIIDAEFGPTAVFAIRKKHATRILCAPNIDEFAHPNIDEVAQLNLAEPAEAPRVVEAAQRRIGGEAEG